MNYLNSDSSIKTEDKNWDAKGEPQIVYRFELTSGELDTFKGILSELQSVYPVNLLLVPPGQPARPAEHKEMAKKVSNLIDRVERSALIDLERAGVGLPLSLEGKPVSGWDVKLKEFLEARIPRIELLQPNAGTLQDSVTAGQIGTNEFEFLQGVFFYAGLDPLNCRDLFVHNDSTERQLDKASKQLDSELRRLWGQGVDLNLHFELRHRNNAIEFMANDPAVQDRKTRKTLARCSWSLSA